MPCSVLYCRSALPHITASVFINDDERGLHADYEKWLEELARMRRSASTIKISWARTTPMPT